METNQNSPKLPDLTASIIQRLPSIIKKKGCGEIWGVDLRSGDEQKIIAIVEKVGTFSTSST